MIIDNSEDILTSGFAAFGAFLTHSVKAKVPLTLKLVVNYVMCGLH